MILFQTLLVQFSNHGSCMQRKANQVFRIIHEFRMTRWLCQIQTRQMIWWHISAITRQKKIITTNSLLSWFYGVLTLFAAIYSFIWYLTSWYNDLTSRHNYLKSSFQTIMLTFQMLCQLTYQIMSSICHIILWLSALTG